MEKKTKSQRAAFIWFATEGTYTVLCSLDTVGTRKFLSSKRPVPGQKTCKVLCTASAIDPVNQDSKPVRVDFIWYSRNRKNAALNKGI